MCGFFYAWRGVCPGKAWPPFWGMSVHMSPYQACLFEIVYKYDANTHGSICQVECFFAHINPAGGGGGCDESASDSGVRQARGDRWRCSRGGGQRGSRRAGAQPPPAGATPTPPPQEVFNSSDAFLPCQIIDCKMFFISKKTMVLYFGISSLSLPIFHYFISAIAVSGAIKDDYYLFAFYHRLIWYILTQLHVFVFAAVRKAKKKQAKRRKLGEREARTGGVTATVAQAMQECLWDCALHLESILKVLRGASFPIFFAHVFYFENWRIKKGGKFIIILCLSCFFFFLIFFVWFFHVFCHCQKTRPATHARGFALKNSV